MSGLLWYEGRCDVVVGWLTVAAASLVWGLVVLWANLCNRVSPISRIVRHGCHNKLNWLCLSLSLFLTVWGKSAPPTAIWNQNNVETLLTGFYNNCLGGRPKVSMPGYPQAWTKVYRTPVHPWWISIQVLLFTMFYSKEPTCDGNGYAWE